MTKGDVFYNVSDFSGRIICSGEKSNIVTNDSSILISMLMNPSLSATNPIKGIRSLAYGSGENNWDVTTPAAPTSTVFRMVNPVGYTTPDSTNYILNDASSAKATKQLRVSFKISNTSASPITIREMGLIGGFHDSYGQLPSTIDEDRTDKAILMNYVIIPRISIAPTSVLSWTWNLTF